MTPKDEKETDLTFIDGENELMIYSWKQESRRPDLGFVSRLFYY